MAARVKRLLALPRRRRGSRHRVLITFLLLALLFVTGSALINNEIKPIVSEMAISRVSNLGLKAINEVVNDQITEGNINYDKMIYFEKDTDGNIAALKTNMSEINRIKTEIVTLVIDKISKIESSQLSIPIGNLFGNDLLSGRGPNLHIQIVPVSYANASFNNVFSDAGINQTRHQIFMNIEVAVSIILPSGNTSTTVSTQICVAETIIVGKVPSTYTYFSNYDSETEAAEDYYDYS